MRLTNDEVAALPVKKDGKIEHAAQYPKHTKLKIRYPDGSKKFMPVYRDDEGKLVYKVPDYGDRKPCYRADEIHRETKKVFYCEGEAVADEFWKLGLAATTAGGANDEKKADFQWARGREVLISPDNDEAGRKHADAVAQICYRIGANSVKCLTLPDAEAKDDFADYVKKNPYIGVNDVDELPVRHVPETINGLPILTFGQLLTSDIEPPEKIMGNLFTLHSTNMIYAEAGAGKTWLCLSMAMCLAFGKKFWSYEVPKRRNVLYIDGEVSEGWMKMRAAELAGGLSGKKVGNFYYQGIDRLTNRPLLNIASEDDQNIIHQIVKRKKIEVVFFDNLSCLVQTEAEENSAESWSSVQRFGLKLRVDGCCVFYVHHANKSGGQRGSSKKVDQLDNNIALEKVNAAGGGAHFRVSFQKARHAQEDEAQSVEAKLVDSEGGKWWLVMEADKSAMERGLEILRKSPEDVKNAKMLAAELKCSEAQAYKILQKAKDEGIIGGSTRKRSRTSFGKGENDKLSSTPENDKGTIISENDDFLNDFNDLNDGEFF